MNDGRPWDYEECVDPDCECNREVIQLELPDEFLPRRRDEEKTCVSE